MDKRESIWPLDGLVLALSGLILYVVATELRFDDPRWLYNAWTYVVAVPLVALLLAVMLHGIASRYVQRSVQVGFLFSICVHLLLMMLAINIVIFSKYFPEVTTGVKPERSPIRRTIPDYLFHTPQEKAETPDWSRPADTTTASRVIPDEQRTLPPLEQTKPKLEMPRPLEPQTPPLQRHMIPRDRASSTLPKPADAPGKLARRATQDVNPPATQTPSIQIPQPAIAAIPQPRVREREVESTDSSSAASSRSRTTDLSSAAPRDVAVVLDDITTPQPASTAKRSMAEAKPEVGDAGFARQRTQPKLARQLEPAGATVAPPTVAVARSDDTATRMLSPSFTPMPQRREATGAQLSASDAADSTGLQIDDSSLNPGALVQDRAAAQMGLPQIASGETARMRSRAGRPSEIGEFVPAGAPTATDGLAAVGRSGDGQASGEFNDRIELDSFASPPSARERRRVAPSPSLESATEPTFGIGPSPDVPWIGETAGLADRVARQAGVVPSLQSPQVAAFDLSRDTRPRREVGGPINPVGTEIAAVESFSRRAERTAGGAAPTPAGMVGQATEEAIERGLAYLASTQAEDGSWSLVGHGERVVLDSHTAATGLSLLAFQGAGYTHRKHQYADTVSRGLNYLIANQRSSGDLYVSENPISDQNVALYSHGIASLALCEAFGMTQDPQLREPAQRSIRYITVSQHPQRGGWRYTPGVSSDTSVTGWMMMALKSGELAGLQVSQETYRGIDQWLDLAKESDQRLDRYRYNPFAPDTPSQRHGRFSTPTMTAVGMLMRMYSGWRRDHEAMQSAADYLLRYPPQVGTPRSPQRDTYYWYYATQVMFHMGGKYWDAWNQALNPMLLQSQIVEGPEAGSWDPNWPVPDRWSPHAGRLYVTTMNLLNLEVYYRHLPIYDETAE